MATVKLEWGPAPTKTQWGHDMVEASVALDKDHTLSLYCERDQTDKVAKAMRPRWKGLTKVERKAIAVRWRYADEVVAEIEAKLKEKNSQ